eukprot:PhM_4_TR11492/c0_g1_i1/m.5952
MFLLDRGQVNAGLRSAGLLGCRELRRCAVDSVAGNDLDVGELALLRKDGDEVLQDGVVIDEGLQLGNVVRDFIVTHVGEEAQGLGHLGGDLLVLLELGCERLRVADNVEDFRLALVGDLQGLDLPRRVAGSGEDRHLVCLRGFLDRLLVLTTDIVQSVVDELLHEAETSVKGRRLRPHLALKHEALRLAGVGGHTRLEDVVAHVRANGRQNAALDVDVALHNVAVETLCAAVHLPLIARVRELEECGVEGLAELHLAIACVRGDDGSRDLIVEDAVEEGVLSRAEVRLLAVFLAEIEGNTELAREGNRITGDEVGIVEGVASVGEGKAAAIGGVLVNSVAERAEVAKGLGHLLLLDENVTIAVDALGPLRRVVLPDGGVVVQEHCQVVLDQILAADTEVNGVPVQELIAQLLEGLLRD